jgi:LuxR family transcriptional regulator, maltose regulon positive regulatory protein
MLTPIVATKLYIPPPRPKVVLRPGQIEWLNQGLLQNRGFGRKLTLISAPAGFGKTTLVSTWVAGCERLEPKVRVAWLSLDETDNDPTCFLTYLVAALQTVAPEIGKGAMDALQTPQPPPTESILITLLNEIADNPDNLLVVLDDYHVLDAKPIDDAVTFLIEHLPPRMHLVIATREDPHLPLARLRVRGQLAELRAADLRFTPAEAAEFLNQVMGLNLSVEDIASLETRTEGWIAGLQLAAISLQGNQDISGFIREFAGDHRYIVDYLVEEVLQSQPEPIRQFLFQTSIVDRLNGSLCDALTARENCSAQLEALQRGNLFIIPLDDKRHWYRYHHLFGDVLRMRLTAEQPDQVAVLHRRASEWYEHNGSMENAIRHALAAGDFARAADLVEMVMLDMRRNRQFATLLAWLKQIPDELVRVRPVLCVGYALASMSCGEHPAVEPRLRDAERWLDTPDDPRQQPESPLKGMIVVDHKEFRRLPGLIALIRAGQALARGDMPETVKYARRVLDLAPDNDLLMLGGASSQLGLVAWTRGDLEAARPLTADGMEKVRQAGYISPSLGAAISLADIQITQGRLHEAMTTFERALQWAMKPGAPVLPGAADMYVGMSDLLREHNDMKTASQYLLTSQALGELAALPQNPYRWCAAMARIKQARGDLDGALTLLEQAERLYDGNFSPNVRPVAARKTRVWLAMGCLDKAMGWAREHGLSAENELSYLREFDHITLARVLLSQYQSDRAESYISVAMGLLERLRKAADAGGRNGSVIEILALQALAHQAQGALPAALLPLQQALALAEPEGYVRLFLDEGSSMLQLLQAASAYGIKPDYTGKLLNEFNKEIKQIENKPDLTPVLPDQPPGESLSQRELEILQLIDRGLSNREISKRLFLALDTVKGHNRLIFGKLQVHRRTEAVARARELGLL